MLSATARRVAEAHNRSSVAYRSCRNFGTSPIDPAATVEDATTSPGILLLDDLEAICGGVASLARVLDAALRRGAQVVVAGDVSLKGLQELEHEMNPRPASGLFADVQPPDLQTRIAIQRRSAS